MLFLFQLAWICSALSHSQGSADYSRSKMELFFGGNPKASTSNSSESPPPHLDNSKPEPSFSSTSGEDSSWCPTPWSCCSSEECIEHCNGGKILLDIIECGTNRSLMVLKCMCATYNDETNLTEVGSCLYDCRSSMDDENDLYLALPQNRMEVNDFMCGDEFNRTGTLCGKCQRGYHPLVHSFNMNCVQCPRGFTNWWKYALVAYLPLTIFFIVVVFFKINVASSDLNGYVFYSQAMSLPLMVRMLLLAIARESHQLERAFRYMASFYGVWNLDFFRSLDIAEICLGTDTLQMLSLDFLLGAYPLLLIMLSYFMIELHDRNFKPLVFIWKPFRRLFNLFGENWEIRTSLIDAFATFLLLSSMKFSSVCFDLLFPIKLYQMNSTGGFNYTYRLYYDATVPYFGPAHLPYAIPAIFVLVFFVLFPGLLLILYPMRQFQRILNIFPIRWYILHTFVDSFCGCYKDGTEPGTRDCRWFASLPFLIRLFLMCIGVITINSTFYAIAAITLVIVALLFIIVEPFKRSAGHLTSSNAIFILLLALWYASLAGIKEANTRSPEMLKLFVPIAGVTGTVPLLYMSAIMTNWIYRNRRFGLQVARRLRARRNGYERFQ